ncbi:MAG: class I SAM-dependent methyltransferase [Gemmatimonadota bacterium]
MWDERYSEDGWFYGTEPNDFLREQVARIPAGGRVLSLGDGEGRNGVFLAERGYALTGVDASAVGVRKARALAQARGVTGTWIHADLADFDLGTASWDGIVSIFCHLPRALRVDVLRRVVRGLAPGGVFLLEAYTPDQLRYGTGGPPDVDLLVSASDLEAELQGLRFLHLAELEREVIEGERHSGLSAVVQAVAMKEG